MVVAGVKWEKGFTDLTQMRMDSKMGVTLHCNVTSDCSIKIHEGVVPVTVGETIVVFAQASNCQQQNEGTREQPFSHM